MDVLRDGVLVHIELLRDVVEMTHGLDYVRYLRVHVGGERAEHVLASLESIGHVAVLVKGDRVTDDRTITTHRDLAGLAEQLQDAVFVFRAIRRAVDLALRLALLQRHQEMVARETDPSMAVRARLTEELGAFGAAHRHPVLLFAVAARDGLFQIHGQQVQHVFDHEVRLQTGDSLAVRAA